MIRIKNVDLSAVCRKKFSNKNPTLYSCDTAETFVIFYTLIHRDHEYTQNHIMGCGQHIHTVYIDHHHISMTLCSFTGVKQDMTGVQRRTPSRYVSSNNTYTVCVVNRAGCRTCCTSLRQHIDSEATKKKTRWDSAGSVTSSGSVLISQPLPVYWN